MATSSVLAGLTVLIIGDSHLATPDFLLNPLHEALSRQGAQVHSIGICGASAGDWLKATPSPCGGAERRGSAEATVLDNATTRPIGQLLDSDKPDITVIVMGDTMASYDKPSFPKAWIWQQTNSLVKALADHHSPCVWVGPSWGSEGGKYGKTYERVRTMSDFLGKSVAPCRYIDSLQFSGKGQWATIDGQHLTLTGYRAWSDAIVKALLQMPRPAGR
ncbi:SGNH/GDSL hydrolase family protein [Pseudomonas sp. COR18]|uniref:SGNH/GDSL hydrolase family protein n=1 Tax=Pseudomonas sp. COR18 TaxID=3399680 RepID=UPI003B006C27